MVKITVAFASLMLMCSVVKADWNIYCPDTKEVVYIYKGDFKDFNYSDFIPNPEDGSRMVCPGTQIPLNGFEYFFWKKGYTLPKMAYNAVSLLTKENGEFVWKPYSEDELINILGL